MQWSGVQWNMNHTASYRKPCLVDRVKILASVDNIRRALEVVPECDAIYSKSRRPGTMWPTAMLSIASPGPT